ADSRWEWEMKIDLSPMSYVFCGPD
ncbi:hypothetical protein L195_g041029, partial [Trifolium pratense]